MANKIQKFPLSSQEEAVTMGTLLGDGFLQKRGSRSFRLKIEHTLAQREFVEWKREKLSRLCTRTQPPIVTPARKTAGQGVLFYTDTSPVLEDIHGLYYKKGVDGKLTKTITQELIDKLPMSPYVLATWWMDDGSVRNDCYGGKIATMGFSQDGEQELLALYLKKWGISCNIVFNDEEKNQKYLSIPAASFPRLVEIIEPIIAKEVPSMSYKLNANRKPRND
jgi:hypothetical protein